jgi:ribose transport system substrate-binding protein
MKETKVDRVFHSRVAAIMSVGLIVALLGAGCGSSGKGSATATSAGSGNVSKYQQQLDAVYKGDFEPPSGGPVTPAKNKKVWLVSVGQNIETAQNLTAGLKEAAGKLGWNLTVFDGKFESSRWLTGIQQAIAAKADGIILFAFDCAPVKAGLEQAAKAKIPVVGVESHDCEPHLETYDMTFARGQNFQEWIENGFAGSQAKWVIAKTKGEAKTILTVETDLFVTQIAQPGIERVFKTCATCKIVDTVTFVGSELGPPLQEKIEQALNKHPEANSFIAAYDAVMTGGGAAAALRASGRANQMAIMGGEGSAPGIELIYNHAGNDACSGINFVGEAYGAMMGLVRIYAGQDPYKGNTGIGSQVCDLEHNLPPKGKSYQPPIDYPAEYEKLWGLK